MTLAEPERSCIVFTDRMMWVHLNATTNINSLAEVKIEGSLIGHLKNGLSKTKCFCHAPCKNIRTRKVFQLAFRCRGSRTFTEKPVELTFKT